MVMDYKRLRAKNLLTPKRDAWYGWLRVFFRSSLAA